MLLILYKLTFCLHLQLFFNFSCLPILYLNVKLIFLYIIILTYGANKSDLGFEGDPWVESSKR